MSDTVKRAIVILPRFDGPDQIEQLRRRFDPLASRIAPHITLVFPFESELSADQLRAHIGQAIQGIAPFKVQLRGITEHDGEYLFLNVVRGVDRLIELHDRLYSGPLASHLMPEIPYHPHVTVGRLAGRTALSNALAIAREVRGTFQTVVRDIATVRIERDGEIWEEYRVSLGSRAVRQ